MLKILLGFVLLSTTCFGQQLDSTFHFNGNHKLNIQNFANHTINQHTKMALQSNGKIIIAGIMIDSNSTPFAKISLIRLTQDGFIDSSFGINGISTLSLDTLYLNYTKSAIVICIQSDDKIVIAANLLKQNSFNENTWMWARMTIDGQLDNSFANNGITYFPLPFGSPKYFTNAVVLKNDDVILINTAKAGKILKLKSGGNVDSSFGTNGLAAYPSFNQNFMIYRGIVQPDGKIIFTGSTISSPSNYYLGRLLPNGMVDSSFGINGSVTTNIDTSDVGFSLAIQEDGRILVAGRSTDSNSAINLCGDSMKAVLLRYTDDGTLDLTFNQIGYAFIDNPVYFFFTEFTDVHLYKQDRILVTGDYQTSGNQLAFMLASYKLDGTLDTSFGDQGIIRTIENDSINWCNYSVFQGPNKILLHGESRHFSNWTGYNPMVARYILDLSLGLLEKGNQLTEMLIYPNPIQQETILRYALHENEEISIQLFDMQGRMVKTFASKQKQQAGNHQMNLVFDARLAEGNYILQISSARYKKQIQLTKKAN